MSLLFTYIFGKTYFLYEKIYADKEHPQYFSSSVIGLLAGLTFAVIIDVALYPINPSLITHYYGWYKYVSVGILLLSWWYFHPKSKYLKIIDNYKKVGIKKKRILGFVSLGYIIILLFLFFKMGNLVREYNLENG